MPAQRCVSSIDRLRADRSAINRDGHFLRSPLGVGVLIVTAMGTPDENGGGVGPQGEGGVATESDQQVKRPRLYRVMLHNDDYTTMEFVVMILMRAFYHPEPAAVRIMLQVHQKGVGTAGVYPYEIAEARIAKVARLAREHEFPLRCTMEPD